MKFLLKLVITLAVIALLIFGVYRYVLCKNISFDNSGAEAMEQRVEQFLNERVASQPDIDAIDGVPNLDVELEDLLAPPSASEGNAFIKAGSYLLSLWRWVTSIPTKFKTVWNWTDTQSAEYRDRIFVSGASTNQYKDWDRTRYLYILQSAAVLDCAAAPDACRESDWYTQRTTRAWHNAVQAQIDELCPGSGLTRFMCAAPKCKLGEKIAKARAWRAATQVNAVEALHHTLHWFVGRYKKAHHALMNLKDGLPDWIIHPIRSMQDHYDEQRAWETVD